MSPTSTPSALYPAQSEVLAVTQLLHSYTKEAMIGSDWPELVALYFKWAMSSPKLIVGN